MCVRPGVHASLGLFVLAPGSSAGPMLRRTTLDTRVFFCVLLEVGRELRLDMADDVVTNGDRRGKTGLIG